MSASLTALIFMVKSSAVRPFFSAKTEKEDPREGRKKPVRIIKYERPEMKKERTPFLGRVQKLLYFTAIPGAGGKERKLTQAVNFSSDLSPFPGTLIYRAKPMATLAEGRRKAV